VADSVKILSDFDICTGRMILAHLPDIVVVNIDCHTGILIDVVISDDDNIIKAYCSIKFFVIQ